MEKSVCISDVHIPYEDKRTVGTVLRFIAKFKPDIIFINGDLMDCMDISSFDKPLEKHPNLKEEIEETKYFLLKLRSIAPKARIIYILGNHSYRLQSYIAKNARELYGLKGLTLQEQLGCEDIDVEIIDNGTKENYIRYGDLFIGHWDKSLKHSGYTAKALLDDKGVSIIQGHTHRLGAIYKRDLEGIKGAWECGCLCDINPKYVNHPNWNQGFLTIHLDKKTNTSHVTVVPIIDHKIVYGDKVFR